jgi:hypothetical protein
MGLPPLPLRFSVVMKPKRGQRTLATFCVRATKTICNPPQSNGSSAGTKPASPMPRMPGVE